MDWILISVLAFLGISLILYVVLAGADFGAGILELTLGKSEKHRLERDIISHAIAPVWEANHVWLILVVVILFMGFPSVYTALSTFLHIPIMALLIGIVGRGCAFTFRHYDSVDNSYYDLYTRLFAWSSLWCAMVIGIIGGSLTLGVISPEAQSFSELYLSPWLNIFCFMVGVFAVCLFAFLAGVYLVGETDEKDRQKAFRRKALIFNVLMVIVGALVFLSAERAGLPLFKLFFGNFLSMGCFLFATVFFVPLWLCLCGNTFVWFSRIIAAIIVSLVLVGWFVVQYPYALKTTMANGGLEFAAAAAPEATLKVLLYALIFGSVLIFPALAYLFWIFKSGRR